MKDIKSGVGVLLAFAAVLSSLCLLITAIDTKNWTALGVFITAAVTFISVLLLHEEK